MTKQRRRDKEFVAEAHRRIVVGNGVIDTRLMARMVVATRAIARRPFELIDALGGSTSRSRELSTLRRTCESVKRADIASLNTIAQMVLLRFGQDSIYELPAVR